MMMDPDAGSFYIFAGLLPGMGRLSLAYKYLPPLHEPERTGSLLPGSILFFPIASTMWICHTLKSSSSTDEPSILNLVSAYLKPEGYAVETASDGSGRAARGAGLLNPT
jgi:hypothetical protein